MILLRPSQIYISSANVDMRKSIDGLAAVVTGKFQLSPFEDAMFVFHNRNLDKVKILYWDREGFCLLYKRMERGRFHFPRQLQEEVYSISEEELEWLLHGLHIEEIYRYEDIRSAHRKLFLETKTCLGNRTEV